MFPILALDVRVAFVVTRVHEQPSHARRTCISNGAGVIATLAGSDWNRPDGGCCCSCCCQSVDYGDEGDGRKHCRGNAVEKGENEVPYFGFLGWREISFLFEMGCAKV